VHGSEGSFLLAPEEGGSLCTFCHQSPRGAHHLFTRTQLEEKLGSLPKSANLCLLCHQPHSSKEKKLLKGSSHDVCRDCHEI
jgi:predicted CXXCH cytochrome family protein